MRLDVQFNILKVFGSGVSQLQLTFPNFHRILIAHCVCELELNAMLRLVTRTSN